MSFELSPEVLAPRVELAPEFWQVAVSAPLPTALTYRAPLDLRADHRLQRGQCVTVPLGKRKATGVLIGPGQDDGKHKLRDIVSIDDERPCLHDSFMKWLEWLAKYYVHPIGQVADMAFPPLERKEKTRKTHKSPVTPELTSVTPPVL